jgi:hypothetical protein
MNFKINILGLMNGLLLMPSALNAMETQQKLREFCVLISLKEFIYTRDTSAHNHFKESYDLSVKCINYPGPLNAACSTSPSYQANVQINAESLEDNNTVVVNWNFNMLQPRFVEIIDDETKKLTIDRKPFTLLTHRDEKSKVRATLTITAAWK